MLDVTDTAGPCPCGSGRNFADCCGPVLARERPAPTAEALMRSRYTAYALGDTDHLLRTLDNRKRKGFDPGDVRAWNADVSWKGLTVLHVEKGGEGETTGTVEFRAAYEKGGAPGAICEKSRFKKKGGRWYYVDGESGGS